MGTAHTGMQRFAEVGRSVQKAQQQSLARMDCNTQVHNSTAALACAPCGGQSHIQSCPQPLRCTSTPVKRHAGFACRQSQQNSPLALSSCRKSAGRSLTHTLTLSPSCLRPPSPVCPQNLLPQSCAPCWLISLQPWQERPQRNQMPRPVDSHHTQWGTLTTLLHLQRCLPLTADFHGMQANLARGHKT